MDIALTIVVAAIVIWLSVRGIATKSRREKRIAYAFGAVALILIGVQGYRNQRVQEEIRQGIALLTGRATVKPPELKFYCGEEEIKADGKKEIRLQWISGSPIYSPNVWVVNVGGSDATDVHGQSYVSQRLDSLAWTGDEEYPRSAGWQINALHAMEAQPIGTFSASSPKPIQSLRMRLVAQYNGPTAVAVFTVRLVRIPGPNYPESSLPCARPSFLRLPSPNFQTGRVEGHMTDHTLLVLSVWISGATLGVAVVGTFVAYVGLRSAGEQLRLAAEQLRLMREEQRARIESELSPVVTSEGTVWVGGWLGRFLKGAAARLYGR